MYHCEFNTCITYHYWAVEIFLFWKSVPLIIITQEGLVNIFESEQIRAVRIRTCAHQHPAQRATIANQLRTRIVNVNKESFTLFSRPGGEAVAPWNNRSVSRLPAKQLAAPRPLKARPIHSTLHSSGAKSSSTTFSRPLLNAAICSLSRVSWAAALLPTAVRAVGARRRLVCLLLTRR